MSLILRLNFKVLVVLLAAWPLAGVQAATVTPTLESSFSYSGFTGRGSYAAFDPSLGELEAVAIGMRIELDFRKVSTVPCCILAPRHLPISATLSTNIQEAGEYGRGFSTIGKTGFISTVGQTNGTGGGFLLPQVLTYNLRFSQATDFFGGDYIDPTSGLMVNAMLADFILDQSDPPRHDDQLHNRFSA